MKVCSIDYRYKMPAFLNNNVYFGNLYSFSNVEELIKNDDLDSLKKVQDISIVNKDLNSLLHITAKMKKNNLSEYLLDEGLNINFKNKKGQSAFNIICSKLDKEGINLFLKYQPDINTSDILGNTPMHNTVQSCEVIDILLKHKANPYILNDEGNPLLHEAVDYPDTLEYLLENNINPNSVNKFQQSLMHIAAKENNQKLAEKLLQYKAEINFVDKFGRTPLFYAQDSEMAVFLLKNGANPNIEDILGKTPLLLANNNLARIILLTYGAEPNKLTSLGNTLLHIAVQKNNLDVAKTLLSFDADTNKLDKNKKTPLSYSSSNEMRKLLLEYGADPDSELYLHYALKTNNEEFFDELLNYNVELQKELEIEANKRNVVKFRKRDNESLLKEAGVDPKDGDLDQNGYLTTSGKEKIEKAKKELHTGMAKMNPVKNLLLKDKKKLKQVN